MKDYVLAEEPQTALEVFSTKESIDILQKSHPEFSEGYSEGDCIYQKIAEILPEKNRMLMHGAVITYGEGAYMFTAPSGTGKSTHIALWHKYLGEGVDIVNGDKPILAVEDEGITVYGTPWGGKENWQKNCKAPLKAVCLIQQGKENRIHSMEPGNYIAMLMQQVYLPKGENAGARVLEMLDELTKRVPFYLLECDMSEEAVKCSFEKLTGLNYREEQRK
jgi:hypothetical protein